MKSVLAPLSLALKNAAPWLSPYPRSRSSFFTQRASGSVVAALSEARGETPGLPRFVDHSELPPDEPYERFIARTMCVPDAREPA